MLVVFLIFLGMPILVSAQEASSFDVLLGSATQFNPIEGTVELPLYRGAHRDRTVWYIVTESSDEADAEIRGVNWSPKLSNALGTVALQRVTESDGVVEFPCTVDFAPEPVLETGPTVFPPAEAVPGSFGDAVYNPLITKGNGIVLNAHQVANDTGLHDKVIEIDFTAGTVKLWLTPGFYDGGSILYLSTEASDPVAATLEGGTFAPNMNAAPGLASYGPESARSSIILIENGETGPGPDLQGLV